MTFERDKFTILKSNSNCIEVNIEFQGNKMFIVIQHFDELLINQVPDENIDELMDYLNYRLNN